MHSIDEMKPSFEQVTSVTDSKEFIENFCHKTLKLLDEFKREYRKAISGQRISDLDSITHKISSTMKWLELDGFISLIKSYNDVKISDKIALEQILNEVMEQSNRIEDSIHAKLNEL